MTPTHRTGRLLATVRSHVRPGSFAMLLAASVLLYVLNGAALETPLGAILSRLARVAVVAASLYVLSDNRPMFVVGAVVACLVLGFELQLWPTGTQTSRVLEDLLAMALQCAAFAVVLREVFRRETSEFDAVVGALGGFLLLLMLFMRLHALVEAVSPGTYLAGGAPLSALTTAELTAAFQYFSTVTLTTVGFGDIVPVGRAARLATGVEAITGQLYLAVVVATLVGRVAAQRE
jgi:voltage-gated potassium channel Kch